MSVSSREDLIGLRRVGRVVATALREIAGRVRPGVSTMELDRVGHTVLSRYGARPAPRLTYGFPGVACISINDEAAHGIPSSRRLRRGDLVNIDVSAELGGYFADTGASYAVEPASRDAHRLCAAGRRALSKALETIRPGARLSALGGAVESEARRSGFAIIPELAGHGVGRGLHEPPHDVNNYFDPGDERRFTLGLVFTVEPFLTTGSGDVHTAADGWTVLTTDGSPAVQYEHTVVVGPERPFIVTA